MKKHYDVVAAVVCLDGKYLCMQKGKTKYEYTSYKWEFPDFSITMAAYLCKPLAGNFHLNEHVAFEWREKDELGELDWAAADVDIVRAICSFI